MRSSCISSPDYALDGRWLAALREELSDLLPGRNRISVVGFDARGYSSNAATADVVASSEQESRSRQATSGIVSVGVSRYPKPFSLPAARADAKSIASTFGAFAGGLYGKANTSTLLDDEVTPASVRHAIDGLSAMKTTDVAIIFFAGHGLPAGPNGSTVFVTGGIALGEKGLPTRESRITLRRAHQRPRHPSISRRRA